MSDRSLDDGIPHAEIARRLERVRAAAAERGLRGLLAVARPFFERPANVAYLSNHFPPFPTGMYWGEMRGIGHAALVVPLAADPILIVDTTFRRDLVAIQDVRHARSKSGPAMSFLPNFAEAIADALAERDLGAGRVGLIGDDVMPVRMHRDIMARLPGLVLEPFDEVMGRLRMVKSEAELRLQRRAARICDEGYAGMLPAIRAGARETEVCAAGYAATMGAGADFVRYVRTYSGPHSAMGVRWPQATDRRLADGELLVTDVVGAYWGQQFDVNRTFVVGRRPSDRQRRQLDAALEATRAAIAAARPGAPAEALVAAANRVIEARGFGAHARPFIGHGIGYETMEPPLLFTGDTTPLEPGMVLCVEPGIEIPGEEGVRIEEEIIVTDGEPEVITRFEPRQWA
ncbi:MAG: Xaa-Pro peptidase family protein [Armatimonadota bacterium]|nr:Xaa-Pro peptidase family protein [Armatimonadota bacterium]MDR7495474.1 Xaa-Pro peptidase family protein [Armatimonadota bacterium]MDR7510435.1 Xaa-Pro peptidase family protein [Armatimonadota bacterium]